MDRDGRFGTYRPMLCAAGGRRSPCGVLLLLDRQFDRGVQSGGDISNGRYAGALVADAEGALWAIYAAYGPSGAWMGVAALDDSECTFAHLTHSMAAMRARGACSLSLRVPAFPMRFDSSATMRRLGPRAKPRVRTATCSAQLECK